MRQADPRSPVEQQGPARWYGVYPGKVVDVYDQQQLGRVQVELIFAPNNNGDTYKVWARVATMMAGSHRGTFFIPDKDDEVLVAFYAGDVRNAYVIGAVWNGQEPPPQTIDSQNNIRVIHTRSGHKLEFDDTDGAAKITLSTPNGHQLILDDGQGQITLQHFSGSSLVMDESGGIKLTALSQMTIEAPMMTVDCPFTQFNGVTQHETMISDAVVGASYTPGAGNIW
jgi:uncharacterized protein involved in type VI secretion and phage assembly